MFHVYADGISIYNPIDEQMALSDLRLTVEMGKAGSFEFRIPTTNIAYYDIVELKTIITVLLDDIEIFRGRILTKERQFDNQINVYCEGDLSFLVDSVQKNEAYIGTARNLFSQIINNHNLMVDEEKQFQIGQITIEDREIIISGQSDVIQDLDTEEFDYKQIAINATTSEWQNTYDYIEGTLISYCGGYMRTRRQNGVTYIDWLADNYGAADQVIEFGVNLLDVNEHLSAESLYTVLIPLGEENLTLEPLTGSKELVDTELAERYGRIVRTHVFDSVTEPETLLENAVRYMETEMSLPVTITVRAVDMHFVNSNIRPIHLGEIVRIRSNPHNIVRELTCTKIDYDLGAPEGTEYTFGNPKQTLTQRYRKDQKAQAAAAKAAAASAAGGSGKKSEKEAEEVTYRELRVTRESVVTLSEAFENAKGTLKRDCGIDVDSITGNVNIKSFAEFTGTALNEQGQSIAVQGQQIAAIHQRNIEEQALLELTVSRVTEIDNRENSHYATFNLTVNDLESAINAKADKITLEALDTRVTNTDEVLQRCGIYLDGSGNNVNLQSLQRIVDGHGTEISRNTANVEAMANTLQSQVSLTASYGTRLNTAEENIAQIQLTADANGSAINLKADKVTVEGDLEVLGSRIGTVEEDVTKLRKLIADSIEATKSDISWMSGKTLDVNNVRASTIQGKYIYESDGSYNYRVATQDWTNGRFYTKDEIDTKIRNFVISVSWDNITGKPDRFKPTKHTHSFSATVSKAVNPSTVLPHTHSVSGTTGQNA